MVDTLTFRQALDLLRGLTTPGLVRLDKDYVALVRKLIARIDGLGFDLINNELNYEEFELMSDIYNNLKYSEVEVLRDTWAESFKN